MIQIFALIIKMMYSCISKNIVSLLTIILQGSKVHLSIILYQTTIFVRSIMKYLLAVFVPVFNLFEFTAD